jgi:hypothetical protein
LTARGEYRDGDLRSNRLVTIAGDASVSPSVALLMRQELLVARQEQEPSWSESVRKSSLWALALRPTGSDVLNALLKFEWQHLLDPIGTGVLVEDGIETRLIAATDVIWAPSTRLELSGRYALRRTVAEDEPESGLQRRLASSAEYMGAHASLELTGRVALRADGRLLLEHASSARRWDVAPQLAIAIGSLEIAGGYRFGDLRDPDFAVRGGPGWFVVVGAHLTEHAFPQVADFWRARLGR